jgi:hypothetical protein
MQDQGKGNGIRPILRSHHKWCSAETAWLKEIMIYPMFLDQ